jgi:hypothetical protein
MVSMLFIRKKKLKHIYFVSRLKLPFSAIYTIYLILCEYVGHNSNIWLHNNHRQIFPFFE